MEFNIKSYYENADYLQVTDVAVQKSGYTEIEILNRYQAAHLGFDGSFTMGTNLFGIDKMRVNTAIVWLGEVPIEWYEEDIKREEQERIRKTKLIAENEKKLYYAGREGTKTERKRDKKASNIIASNFK